MEDSDVQVPAPAALSQSERDDRQFALMQANNSGKAEDVVARAKVFLAFLKGEENL